MTLAIPDAVLQRAKLAAAERGITFSAFVAEAMEEKLNRERAIEEKP